MIILQFSAFLRHNKNIPFIVFFVFLFCVATCLVCFWVTRGEQLAPYPLISEEEVHPIDSPCVSHGKEHFTQLPLHEFGPCQLCRGDRGRTLMDQTSGGRFNGWDFLQKMAVDGRCFPFQIG